MKEKEKLLWEKLSIDYMSDESDDEQGNLVKHKLPWRSASKCNSHLCFISDWS